MTVARKPTTRRAQRKVTPGSDRRTSGRTHYWSREVNERSDALDLQPRVFTQRSARAVALSLKRSAERSRRRKSAPLRSAMSMLNFYINRAGRQLSPERRRVLENAKQELRLLFGKRRSPRATGERRPR
jgi:predicted ATPase